MDWQKIIAFIVGLIIQSYITVMYCKMIFIKRNTEKDFVNRTIKDYDELVWNYVILCKACKLPPKMGLTFNELYTAIKVMQDMLHNKN